MINNESIKIEEGVPFSTILDIYNLLSEKDKNFVTNDQPFEECDDVLERFIILLDNHPVGFVELFNDSYHINNKFIEIAIDENFRNLGLAQNLINYILKKYDKEHYTYIWLVDANNNKSINLAKKLGFSKINNEKYIKLT